MPSAKNTTSNLHPNNCLTFYADDSNLRLHTTTTIPNTVLIGGVLVDVTAERKITQVMNYVKAQFGQAGCPVKYNFRDLKKKYEERRLLEVYQQFLQSSQQWRRAIFEQSLDIDFTIIVTGIVSHSSKRETIKEVTEKLTRFGFINLLERL